MESPLPSVNIVLADDHIMFAEALSVALNGQQEIPVRVTGVASNGEILLDLLRREPADLVLLDLNMPVMNGLETIPALQRGYPDLPIIVLTQYRDPKIVRECLQEHGVAGYLLKSSAFAELLEAIRQVLDGASYISRDLTLYPREAPEAEKPAVVFPDAFLSRYNLTRREIEILQLVAQAKSNAEIAGTLFISRQTVIAHRKNIMRKLNIPNTPALVRFAIQHQGNG